MAESAFSEERLISSMFCGVWKSRCLSVLVSLAVPELLCNSCSPVSIREIAERTGCCTDEKIYKLLRTMAQWGIGEELSEKSFQANRAMELLRRDKGPSLGHMVSYYGSDEVWTAMLGLPEAIKHGGDTAFELVHGMNLYDYMYKVEEMQYCTDKRKLGDVVSEMGTKERRHEFADNYDRGHEHVVSTRITQCAAKRVHCVLLGQVQANHGYRGGEGVFLSRILKLPGCEQTHGFLFDFPDVIERAKDFIAKENISDRVTLICGDILKDASQTKQVDTIIVKNLFVIFTQEQMVEVLKTCHQVLTKDGKFIIVNSCSPEAGDTEHNVARAGLHPGFRGIHIMTLCKMGNFRTKSEWLHLIDWLCTRVAFQLNQVYETGDGPTLFELIKRD